MYKVLLMFYWQEILRMEHQDPTAKASGRTLLERHGARVGGQEGGSSFPSLQHKLLSCRQENKSRSHARACGPHTAGRCVRLAGIVFSLCCLSLLCLLSSHDYQRIVIDVCKILKLETNKKKKKNKQTIIPLKS